MALSSNEAGIGGELAIASRHVFMPRLTPALLYASDAEHVWLQSR